MKNLLLAGVAIVAFAGAASAADLPARMPLKAPPAAYDYNWQGFYAGAFYASAIGQADGTTPGSFDGHYNINQNAFSIGATAGYNWRLGSNWLAGLEGDVAYLGIKRGFDEWDDGGITARLKADWLATARARFGYLTGPSLLYVTGGAAFVHVQDTFGDTSIVPASVDDVRAGWTAGAGIETKLSHNWSAKTEYLYVDAGSTSFASMPLFGSAAESAVKHQFHMIKSGLTYAFGGPGEGLPFFGGPLLPNNHRWGGFYAGVNAGGVISSSQIRGTNAEVFTPGTGTDNNGVGFAGGLQAGYNAMLTPAYFVGLEGDVGYLGLRHGYVDWNDGPDDIFTLKTSWYATARARIGTNTGPALLYVTGGAAWVHLSEGFATPAPFTGDVTSRTGAGWTVGGGTEVALNAAWSARLESLYIDAGSSLHNDTVPGLFLSGRFKDRFTVVRAGLNYQFGGH